MNTDSNALKVAVMGSGGVGKSALTVKFVQGIFIDKYDPTIEDSYRKQIYIDGNHYIAEILDTAGTEQFTAMRDLYIKDAEGIILVFSLTTITSVKDLEPIFKQIQMIKEDVPIVLCANKCDLKDDRIIDQSEYPEISEKFGGPIFETSAKTEEGVNDAFVSIFRSIIERREVIAQSLKRKRKRCNIL